MINLRFLLRFFVNRAPGRKPWQLAGCPLSHKYLMGFVKILHAGHFGNGWRVWTPSLLCPWKSVSEWRKHDASWWFICLRPARWVHLSALILSVRSQEVHPACKQSRCYPQTDGGRRSEGNMSSCAQWLWKEGVTERNNSVGCVAQW